MNCPVDGTTLAMSDRAGIEIDYCPTCRGVWLDRGELDKIIERTSDDERDGALESRGEPLDDERSRGGRRRKRSMLGDLFELGG
ncbi:MAG TPA: zf-TFIIB domain-containing protein [Gaiellaceae bacterium]|nr:zf-TFIIB domain-containing protein [Gaiellaceae bacterium]